MNDQNFTGLKYFPDHRLNIRQIENVDPKAILRGNIKELLGVMNDLAYVDIENDEFVGGSDEAKKLYKLSQYGLQYMIHTVSKLGDNALLLRDYLQIEEEKRKKMLELLTSQEETIRSLKEKKKVLHKTEKHYKKILNTLNTTDGEITNIAGRKYSSYDSENEKKEEVIPHNVPKPKKGTPKGQSPKNAEFNNNYIRPQAQTNFETYSSNEQYSDNRYQPAPGINRPTTSYGMNTDSSTGENKGRFRVINPPPIDTYHDDYSSNKETATFKNQEESDSQELRPQAKRLEEEEAKKEQEKKQAKFNTQITKNKANDSNDEDEYEDDFELSESFVPENLNSRLGKRLQPPTKESISSSQERRKEDPLFAETTISMDFDKEFNKNYLENLDKLVNKNKTSNIEMSLKKNY